MGVAELTEGRQSLLALVRRSLFVRPAVFVLSGFLLAGLTLYVDATVAGVRLPMWLHFEPDSARLLLGTLAGAMLTLTGITFWIRAASVQLTSSQFTARVVHGFLEDWFQQSIMGLLLGIFVYIVMVFRALPPESVTRMPMTTPHLSVNLAVVLAGGSVLVILHAIRHSVQSMQVEQLARRITDATIARVRRYPPLRETPGASTPVTPPSPLGRGHVIRATTSGSVESIDERRLLDALPEDVTVRLEVRRGLFVISGRPLATVWGGQVTEQSAAAVRAAVSLERTRRAERGIAYGIQQLVDVAVGCLSQGASDVASVREVIAHLELVFAELSSRHLPATSYTDDANRLVLRPRIFCFDDYLRMAFDRLRLASAPFPMITLSLLTMLGTLAREAEDAGAPDRAASLRRQATLAVAASEAAGQLDDDVQQLREEARRQGVDLPAGSGGHHQPTGAWQPFASVSHPSVGVSQPFVSQPVAGASQESAESTGASQAVVSQPPGASQAGASQESAEPAGAPRSSGGASQAFAGTSEASPGRPSVPVAASPGPLGYSGSSAEAGNATGQASTTDVASTIDPTGQAHPNDR